MITKREAQEKSLSKWYEIKAEFLETFTAINEPCGFCVYCTKRPNENGCRMCDNEFPEIYRICNEMIGFFNAKYGEVNKMIDAIIKTIKKEV